MLKAAPVSPRRLLTGVAGVALLAATALALTASGTRATAAVTAQLQDTIGVDFEEAELELAALALPTPPVPPAPPSLLPSVPATVPSVPPITAIPPVPPMPQLPEATPVPPAPPVPPIPPAPGVGGDTRVTVIRSRDGQAVRRVIRTRDGRDLDLSTLPEISNRRCGPGDRPLVRQERRDGRRLTVICTDRIERVAERAASMAVDARAIERDALRGALEGLRGARTTIDANPQLTGEQKRRAREGIEEGIREIEADLAEARRADAN